MLHDVVAQVSSTPPPVALYLLDNQRAAYYNKATGFLTGRGDRKSSAEQEGAALSALKIALIVIAPRYTRPALYPPLPLLVSRASLRFSRN